MWVISGNDQPQSMCVLYVCVCVHVQYSTVRLNACMCEVHTICVSLCSLSLSLCLYVGVFV